MGRNHRTFSPPLLTNFNIKAPKKLFIKPEQIKVEMIPGGELPNVGIQYIRKDALLEWLQQGFDWIKNPVISVQQIIDKLNSL